MLIDLQNLLLLQALDIQISELSDKIDLIPGYIEKLQDSQAEKESELQKKKDELDDQSKLQRKLERDLQDNEGKLIKLQVQLNQLKSNEEYRTMLRQIDTIKYQNGEIENAILETFEEIDAKKKELKHYKVEVEEFKKEISAAMAEKNRELEELNAKLADLKHENTQIRRDLEPGILDQYDKLMVQERLPPVVAIDGECCGGCYLALRPKVLIEFKRNDKLNRCENCFRFLYWKPPAAEEN